MVTSSIEYVKRLKKTSMPDDTAEAVVQIMEDILGTPLTQAVYDSKTESLKTEIVAKFDLIKVMIESHKSSTDQQAEAMLDRFKSLSKEVGLREGAFEDRIQTAIAKERVWLLSGVGSLIVIVGTIAARLWWLGHLSP